MRRERVGSIPGLRLGVAAVASLLVLSLSPRPADVAVNRSLHRTVIAAAAGYPAEALRHLETALEREPALAGLHLPAAHLALQADDPVAAGDHLTLAPIDSAPACLQAEIRLASPSAALPLPDLTADCLVMSRRPQAWVEAVLRRGSADLAKQALELRVTSFPEEVWAWDRLAALTAIVEPEQAEAMLLRALAARPQGSPMLDGLWGVVRDPGWRADPGKAAALIGELAASIGDWPVAALALERAVGLAPDLARAHAYLGLATTLLGGDGLPDLQVAAGRSPDDAVVRSLLGQYWLRLGDADRAQREFGHARRLDPANPAIAAALGSALAATGDYSGAAEAYLEAAMTAPQHPGFWLLTAEFSLQHEFDVGGLGLPAARNAVTLDARSAQALSALALASHLTGRAEIAERLAVRSLELDSANAGAWYRLGLILLDSGRYPAAGLALQQAVELDRDGPHGRLARLSLERLP